MENGQAIGGFGTVLESGNHTTEMTTKTFTLAPNGKTDFWTDVSRIFLDKIQWVMSTGRSSGRERVWAVFGIFYLCQASKSQEVNTAKEHEWCKYFLEQTFALWQVKSGRFSSICAVGAFGDTFRRQLLALSTVERVYVWFLDGRKMLPDRKVTHSPGV